MTDKTKINIKNYKGEMLEEVSAIYRRGNVVAHKAYWPDDGFTVTEETCGFAYRSGFSTKDGAKAFVDYIASIPELANIKCPEDAKALKETRPEIVIAMRNKYEQILASEPTPA